MIFCARILFQVAAVQLLVVDEINTIITLHIQTWSLSPTTLKTLLVFVPAHLRGSHLTSKYSFISSGMETFASSCAILIVIVLTSVVYGLAV